jgi:hypothetical protein
MKLRFQIRTLLLAIALLIALGADTGDTDGSSSSSSGCGGGPPPPLLNDPSFDLWCGNDLCSWEVEAGEIEQVETWNAGDHGVGLLSDPTILGQLSQASSDDTDCIWFSLMVDSEAGVTVQLEVDFRADGIAEYAHPIPSTDWTTFGYHIRPPESWDRVQFRIRKTGAGDATLAQIMAERDSASMCASQDPLEYDDLPLGYTCAANEECDSGVCQGSTLLSSGFDSDTVRMTCGECQVSSCDEGQACGLAFTSEAQPTSTCMAPASKVLGEACMSGQECGTGVCCDGRCSECCSGSHACGEDANCERRWSPGDAHTRMMPWMCNPDERDRAQGEACMGDSECTGATCGAQSQLRLCDAGGNPCTSDAECPGYDFEDGRCVTLGARDGACLGDGGPGLP